jgi:hypothetical protein
MARQNYIDKRPKMTKEWLAGASHGQIMEVMKMIKAEQSALVHEFNNATDELMIRFANQATQKSPVPPGKRKRS